MQDLACKQGDIPITTDLILHTELSDLDLCPENLQLKSEGQHLYLY